MFSRRDAQLRHEALHRGQDRVVAAARAPAHLLVGLEVLGRSAALGLRDQLERGRSASDTAGARPRPDGRGRSGWSRSSRASVAWRRCSSAGWRRFRVRRGGSAARSATAGRAGPSSPTRIDRRTVIGPAVPPALPTAVRMAVPSITDLIAPTRSSTRNGRPRTWLTPIASTRNRPRISRASWPEVHLRDHHLAVAAAAPPRCWPASGSGGAGAPGRPGRPAPAAPGPRR